MTGTVVDCRQLRGYNWQSIELLGGLGSKGGEVSNDFCLFDFVSVVDGDKFVVIDIQCTKSTSECWGI